jgi:hypothetical protein
MTLSGSRCTCAAKLLTALGCNDALEVPGVAPATLRTVAVLGARNRISGRSQLPRHRGRGAVVAVPAHVGAPR